MSEAKSLSPSKQLCLITLTLLLLSGWCFGQATIKLSSYSGWPTYSVRVSGSNFSPSVAVDIYFDSTKLTSGTTDSTGVFSNILIKVPASALPGYHEIRGATAPTGTSYTCFLVTTNWLEDGFDSGHTGFNPYENVLSPANVGKLKLHWSYGAVDPPQDSSSSASSVAVAGGIAYFSSTGGLHKIYALNATTGSLRWSYTASSALCSQIAVGWGAVYFGTCDGKVYALNAQAGAFLWTYQTGNAIVASPILWNNMVYIGSTDHKVYALNASTGALVWSYTTGGIIHNSPSVNNGAVYFGSDDGKFYALNPKTGALVWSVSTGGTGYWHGGQSAVNGIVYATYHYTSITGGVDAVVYAFNACTGTPFVWHYTDQNSILWSPMTIANGVIYQTSGVDRLDNIQFVHARLGYVIWQRYIESISTNGVLSSARPTVANGVVYYTGNPVVALEAHSGAVLWIHSLIGVNGNASPAVVTNGMLYYVDGQGILFAYGL